MTDRRSVNPVRSSETRGLTGTAEAAATSALVTRACKRRLFGPLFYSTLVFAAISLLYLGTLRVAEWAERETARANEVSPEKELSAALVKLGANTWQARVEGANSLGDLVRRYGPGEDRSTQRAAAVSALRNALSDGIGPMRAAAADGLAASPQAARAAKNDLTAALKDEDMAVRLSAAKALLAAGGESEGPALRALADVVADTTPGPEHIISLDTMVNSGKAGNIAAVQALVRRLSNVNEPMRGQEISALASRLELEMLLPALEPLLNSTELRRRAAAALAVVASGSPIGTMGGLASSRAPVRIVLPKPYRFATMITILEQAVGDTSLELDLRVSALQALNSIAAAGPLRRSALKLARQLELPDADSRVAAARLLHFIDPNDLAGINAPDENP